MLHILLIVILALTLAAQLYCWLNKRAVDKMPAHDPMDWRVTATSKAWDNDYCCPQCKGTIVHREFMADVCFGCGYSNPKYESFHRRSYRKIWDGEKWVWQYKYGNGPKEFEISTRKLHS